MPCNSFLGFKDDQLALDDEEEKSCSSFDWKCAIVASLLLAVIIIGIFAAIIISRFTGDFATLLSSVYVLT